MRITFPNPLGPPITLDTDNAKAYSPLSSLPIPALVASRRGNVRILVILIFLVGIFTISPSPPLPPRYRAEWKRERSLPWTYTNAVFPEGREGRYLKFDPPAATGFNHQLQGVLLQHHLAILGNRSLAFEPFVQDKTILPFKLTLPPWRSSIIPTSAFISTVISGFEKYYGTPRAVPASHYRKVCPPYKEHVYTLKTEDNPAGDIELVGDGQTRIHQLQVLLAGSDSGCVRIEGTVFDDHFFDSSAPLQMYETFAKSPVLAQFTFSPTVFAILNRILPELSPDSNLYDLDRAGRAVSAEPKKTGGMWRHVLALHLRKGGEWEDFCVERAKSAA